MWLMLEVYVVTFPDMLCSLTKEHAVIYESPETCQKYSITWTDSAEPTSVLGLQSAYINRQ
jgi:hypothetical protein